MNKINIDTLGHAALFIATITLMVVALMPLTQPIV